MAKLKLYRFEMDCGRMGMLSGTFVTESLKPILGKRVYFGEVLGKHSEIEGVLDEGDFTLLTNDQDFINKFVELECESGHNPFDYFEPEDEEDEEEDEDNSKREHHEEGEAT